MKKMIRLISVLMIATLVLAGCRKTSDKDLLNIPGSEVTGVETTGVPTSGADTKDVIPTTAPTVKDDTAPTVEKPVDTPEAGATDPTNGATDIPGSDPAAPAETGSAATADESDDSGSWFAGLISDFIATPGMSYDMESSLARSEGITMGKSGGSGYADGSYSGYGEDGSYPGYDGDSDIDAPVGGEPVIDPPVWTPDPYAGLLTAAEWNDNRNFDFLKNLIEDGQGNDFDSYFKEWGLAPYKRLVVHAVNAEGAPLVNASVTVFDNSGNSIWNCRTDINGMAYAYYSMLGNSAVPANIAVDGDGVFLLENVDSADLLDGSVKEMFPENAAIVSGAAISVTKPLDLMFVTDTTGSMGDELRYLQVELEDVISRVKAGNPNLGIRLSVNFYRDLEDDYVVRSYPFTSGIEEQLRYLRAESACGGGDYEEAVEMALDDAINNHDWNEDSIKLMFIILDAPPHNTQEIKASLAASITSAAQKGIRIIPIAASGVDKSTEFLLRALAMATGGTYTFLTDDSGVGGEHLVPTIGSYTVEQLNDLMVRIIAEYTMGK